MKAGVDAMVGPVANHSVVYIERADHLSATAAPSAPIAWSDFCERKQAAQLARVVQDDPGWYTRRLDEVD
jgi:hypothetical protein